MSTQCTHKTYPTSGNSSQLQGICKALWFAGFLFVESNTNSESLFVLLLAVMINSLPSHSMCKENGPLAYLLWILVFDNQHNQIGLMNLQVIVL